MKINTASTDLHKHLEFRGKKEFENAYLSFELTQYI